MGSRSKILVIDGSGYFFRAYYAVRSLSTSKGFPTNAVFGFVNMLLKVIESEKPKYLAIAFDTPKPSFRKERYADYKAHRQAPPDDLIKQIPVIHRAVDAFGIPRLVKEGYEADDLIGTLATRAVPEGFDVEIITGDKDLMQLVTDRVTLFDTMKDRRIDVAGVREKLGVEPRQVIDLLALMGDASDNIPGVSGIGEKTAVELLKTFGTLENLYLNLDKVKQEKRRQTLLEEKENALLSRELATVKCDVDFALSWEALKYRGPHLPELKALFEELEFFNLMKRLGLTSSQPSIPSTQSGYEAVTSIEKLKQLIATLRKAPLIAVDTETTSLSVQDARCVGISVCAEGGKAYYLPFGHHERGNPAQLVSGQLDEEFARSQLAPLFQDPAVRKVGQNIKYDLQILRRWGVELRGVSGDTLVASYLVDPAGSHNLDALALRYLNHRNITYEEVTGKGKSQISFAEVEIEKATQYSAEDADVCLRLHSVLLPELERRELMPLYRDIEVPLALVLADMEYHGVLVDAAKLSHMGESLEDEMREMEEQIHRLGGSSFNINSPKQLSQILFEKLGLPVIRRTKTGVSTDENVLKELCDKHPICEKILRFRELQKLRSTYVEGLLSQIHPATGRVHTHYNQTVTATGRLSSSDPNLQNIPVGGQRYDIRSVFMAAEGWQLLSVDYSQIELRLLADMSGDKELVRAFSEGEDIHERTARLIFGSHEVTAEQRRIAKTINFGVIYGQTPYGLSQTLKIPPARAKEFIEAYFDKYQGVKAFLGHVIEEAREKGYVTTRWGRRRYFPEIRSENRMAREMAERAAINAPIQGTAADLIKKAMVSLHARLQREKCNARMVLQVHDELVLEVPNDERKQVEAIVCEEMEGAMALSIPLKVDVGWGQDWAACG